MRCLLAPLCLTIAPLAQATHYLAAEIDLYFLGGDQYEVRLLLWRDCIGLAPANSEAVDYSSPCGSGALQLSLSGTTDVSPLCIPDMGNGACNGGGLPGIERVEYSTIVTLQPCNEWLFQYNTCCLVAANNLAPVNVDLVTHTTLNNVDMSCRSTPRFAHPGLPFRASNGSFTLDMAGTFDGPGTAQYSLVNLLTPGGTSAPYNSGYSGAVPYPGLSISTTTGIMTTSTSASVGYWILVPKLEEYDGGTLLASVERAFAMPTGNLSNQPPLATDGALTYLSGSGIVTGARTMEVPVGGTICATMDYSDPDAVDSVFLSTDITTALPGSSVTLTNGAPALAEFCWTVPPGSAGTYRFIMAASDERCPVDQDQYSVYEVRVSSITSNPCGATVVNDPTETRPERLRVSTDAAETMLQWELPSGHSASHLALYDAHGRLLADRSLAPANSGALELPTGLPNSVYVIVCGEHRTRFVLER